ncbi:MAG: hypothetical protein E7677_05865 [Ruminococcaceae bacterium]|nr:hypothetical protein [Oscillospiraceae bacterium]
MILFFVFLLLALLVSVPYITVLYKRARMLRRLVKVARREGFRVRRLHRVPYLCLNRASKYDLLFEAENHAYAVKLWSAVKRNTVLTVKGGSVMESVTVSNPFEPTTRKPYVLDGFWHRVPITKSNFKLRRGKLPVGILLCYPAYNDIVRVSVTGKRKVEWGEQLFEKILCNPRSFEEILIKDAKNFESAHDSKDALSVNNKDTQDSLS